MPAADPDRAARHGAVRRHGRGAGRHRRHAQIDLVDARRRVDEQEQLVVVDGWPSWPLTPGPFFTLSISIWTSPSVSGQPSTARST